MKKKVVTIIIALIILFLNINISFASENTETHVMLDDDTQMLDNSKETLKNIEVEVYETGGIYQVEEYGSIQKYQDVKVRILEGKYKGQEFETKYCISYDINGNIDSYSLEPGNKANTQITVEDGKITNVVILNYERAPVIYIMIGIFFLVILLIGRTKGIKAIIAFVLTIIAIFFVMLQSIINGQSAILMSIVVSVGIIIITFVIISGFSKKTLTAIIGTSGGVICAGMTALIVGAAAKLSGVNEEAIFLSANTQNLIFNFKELLFAGIVISSLGACMDVGMSIASALDELKEKKPDIGKFELIKSGMNIGGDIIGTMTNTLILAYIGGAINIVLLYIVEQFSINEIINIEIIATDVISAITASLGVMFTVPITAVVYGLLNKKNNNKEDNIKNNDKDRSRSLKL